MVLRQRIRREAAVTAKAAALIIGIFFLAIGGLGFVPNPIVSPPGLFAVNPARNILHLASGGVLLVSAARSRASLRLKGIGTVYAVLAVLSFVAVGADGMILGVIDVREADKWFHAVLTAVILGAGFGLADERRGRGTLTA